MASCETREYPPVQEAVAREIKGIDLDLGFLSLVDEADVAVRHHGFDFQPAIARDDHQQRLRRCDNSADRMNRKLLDHPVHRSGQLLKLRLLLGFDQVLGESVAFCSALVSSSDSVRRYSASAWRRVSRIAATAASASCRWLFCTPSSACCSSSSWRISK